MIRFNSALLNGKHFVSTVSIKKNDLFLILIIIFFSLSISMTKADLLNFKSISNAFKSNKNLRQQRVLLISFGGFRHDYINNFNLVNFNQFLEDGVKSAYLDPQFTTQSFPNSWSMVTGSYVETHGIIANKFYDPDYDEYFSTNKHNLKWWNRTEPIWYTTALQGVKTGVYHWPGSETMFYNHTGGFYKKMIYNDNTPFHVKANHTVNWMINDGFKFVCMYHNQPDSIAHKYGINSPEFNVTLEQLDESFGNLINQLKESGLYYANDFNMIVVSDHGMVNVRKNIVVSDYFNENDAVIWSFSRNLIHLKPLIDLDTLLLKLSKIPDITITLKEDMPERLHYKNNKRIGDVIVSALEGVGFIYVGKDPIQMNHNGRISTMMLSKEHKKKLMIAAADKATHGYDKSYMSMKGIFLARGAMFKKNYTSETSVDNVDIHPLLCNILAVECDTRNGSFERMKKYLRFEHRILAYESDRHKYHLFNNNSNSLFLVSTINLLKLFFYALIATLFSNANFYFHNITFFSY